MRPLPNLPSICGGAMTLIFAILLVVLPLSRADSLPIPSNQSDYVVDAWTSENGLPQNSILCMAQTPGGYLWLGTFNGLARFDGVRFTVFNPVNTPALRSARIVALYADRNGWLWVVSEEGFLTRLAEGRFEAMNGKAGLVDGPVSPKGLDPEGNIWMAVAGHSLRTLVENKFVDGILRVLKTDECIQVLSASRTLWFRANGRWERVENGQFGSEVAKIFHSDNLFLTVPARDGDVWLVGHHSIGKLRSGRLNPLHEGVAIDQPTDAVEDIDGNLLIGTWTQGALSYTKSGHLEPIPLVGGASALAVRTMMLDREGNPWIGTDLAGVQRLKKKTFRTFQRDAKPGDDVIRSVTQDGAGRTWCVTSDHTELEVMDANGLVRKASTEEGTWWSVTTAKDGEVWAGSASGGLCRFEGMQSGPIWRVEPVRALAPSEVGGVWVGTDAGLWHATKAGPSQVELPVASKPWGVRAVLEEKGNLWIGLMGGGVWRRALGKWESFGKEKGLVDSQVVSLLADQTGVLWVGTVSGGLHRFKDGVFKDFQRSSMKMPTTVLCIVEDELGYLWMGSLDGIYRVAREELNEFADGLRTEFILKIYDRGDGLGTAEMSEGRQPTACRGSDGRIWFATINGLSVVDPKSVPSNPVSPPVIIEEVLVNDLPVGFGGSGKLMVPPLSQRVDIRYTGISLKGGTQVRFKRRLEGLEDSWVDVGMQRNATYYNLPPGKYRFQVMAANGDGVWNRGGATLSLRAMPAWWQAWWFRTGLIALVGSLLAAAVWFRVRATARAQMAREAFSRQLMESQEQERRRISAELHDGLGQTLLIVKHQANLGARVSGNSPETIERWQVVSRSTQAAIDEVRTIVSALSPALLGTIGLSGALSSMLRRAVQSGAVNLTWQVENMEGVIPKGREIELYRVVQEGLNNIVKHSTAASASVHLRREPERWILEIRDDGCGFDVNEVAQNGNAGGFGLNGIRERIRILGGVLTIVSARGKGILLQAEAPVPRP